MKKIVYPSCGLCLCLIVLFFTSCSTVKAAKKAPEVSDRQEQPVAGDTEHVPDAVSGATGRTVPDDKSAKTEPAAPVSVKPAQKAEKSVQRKSGAAHSAAGAPAVSRKVPQSRKPAGLSPVKAQEADLSAADSSGAPVKASGAAVSADSSVLPGGTKTAGTQSVRSSADSSVLPGDTETGGGHAAPVSDGRQPVLPEAVQPVAGPRETVRLPPSAQEPPKPLIPLTPLVPAEPISAAEEGALQEDDTELTALPPDELDTAVQHTAEEALTPQTYETSLAALISDFEDQGGSHGYEPPRTFHEEMLDLFSPHIFSVALSKEPETERKVSVSRSAAVEEKQRLEIVYPGHGWVYVGEQTSQQGLRYEQRKLQDNTSIFTFSAEKTGQYVLHFSYFDVFSDDFITDAVAVSVGAAKSSGAKTTVRAPEYKSTPPADEAVAVTDTAGEVKNSFPPYNPSAGKAEAADMETVTSAAVSAGSSEKEAKPLTPEELLKKARTALSAADAPAALEALDRFFAGSSKNIDEGWFLRGRAYELNGPARNIRLALDSYKTVTEAFPQSKYWAAADARIRYITGFYINIQ